MITILRLRNGRKPTANNVLKSLITQGLPAKWNFLVTYELLKQISSKVLCRLTLLLIQVSTY